MTNESERIELYEIVLTDGTAEDVCRYVNRKELLRLGLACGCRPMYDKWNCLEFKMRGKTIRSRPNAPPNASDVDTLTLPG